MYIDYTPEQYFTGFSVGIVAENKSVCRRGGI